MTKTVRVCTGVYGTVRVCTALYGTVQAPYSFLRLVSPRTPLPLTVQYSIKALYSIQPVQFYRKSSGFMEIELYGPKCAVPYTPVQCRTVPLSIIAASGRNECLATT
jgi:hypothetical protein